jgi:hypothetical protein
MIKKRNSTYQGVGVIGFIFFRCVWWSTEIWLFAVFSSIGTFDFLFNRFELRQFSFDEFCWNRWWKGVSLQIVLIEKCVNIYFDQLSMIDLLRVFRMMKFILFFLILFRRHVTSLKGKSIIKIIFWCWGFPLIDVLGRNKWEKNASIP